MRNAGLRTALRLRQRVGGLEEAGLERSPRQLAGVRLPRGGRPDLAARHGPERGRVHSAQCRWWRRARPAPRCWRHVSIVLAVTEAVMSGVAPS